MRNPKSFLVFLFIFALFLFLLDFPFPIKLGNYTVNLSNINIHLGQLKIKRELSYKLGLDLQGGTKLIYKVDMSNIPSSEQQAAFEGARNIIERRINFFGVTEPTIQTLKVGSEYRIIIELPGLKDIGQAIDLIGRTAQLTFWEQGDRTHYTLPDIKESAESSLSAMLLRFGLQNVFGTYSAQTKLTGKDLKSARVAFDPNSGAPQVQLVWTSEGTKLFSEITVRNIGKPLAIVLDNQVIQAPVVQQQILNGNAVITGNFTTQQARSLTIQLNSGSLPAPLRIIGQTSLGATLGIDSLKKSIIGGVLGLISIVVFMGYLYRKEGILASLALLIYIVIVLSIFKIIPITLTLAGIAGFILSVGMAVDANILIFERMREEIRAGKGRDTAIRLGFVRAWSSIRDSNVSSLITSFILYYFGSGIVRGFALTLAIGILISMFSAIVVTRNLLVVFDRE